jgi:hypothetical protein
VLAIGRVIGCGQGGGQSSSLPVGETCSRARVIFSARAIKKSSFIRNFNYLDRNCRSTIHVFTMSGDQPHHDPAKALEIKASPRTKSGNMSRRSAAVAWRRVDVRAQTSVPIEVGDHPVARDDSTQPRRPEARVNKADVGTPSASHRKVSAGCARLMGKATAHRAGLKKVRFWLIMVPSTAHLG